MWFLKAAPGPEPGSQASVAAVRTDPSIGTQGPKSIAISYHLSDCNKLSDYLIGCLCRVSGEEAERKKGRDQMIEGRNEKRRLN